MANTGWSVHPAPPMWTIVRAVAVYRNEHSVQITFPVAELHGEPYLKSAWGQRVQIRPYEDIFDDPVRGLLTFIRSLLEDPKTAAIRDIGADLCLLSGSEFNAFLEAYPDFKKAFEDDFAGLPFSRLAYFSKIVSEELYLIAERLKGKQEWCN
jgi:hypothetical protein